MKGNLINLIRNGFMIWCAFGFIPILYFLFIINRLDLVLTALNSIRDMGIVLTAYIIVFGLFCFLFFMPSWMCFIYFPNNTREIKKIMPCLIINLLSFFLAFFIFLKYQFNLYLVIFIIVIPIVLSIIYSIFRANHKINLDRKKQKIDKRIILVASSVLIYILLLWCFLSEQLSLVNLILIILVFLLLCFFIKNIRSQNINGLELLSENILSTFVFMIALTLAFLFPQIIYLIDVVRSEEELNCGSAMVITFFMFLLSIIPLIPAVLDYQSSTTIPKFPARRIYSKKQSLHRLVFNTVCILLMGFFVMYVFLGKGRQINYKALTALGVVQADVRQYKVNREHYLPTMFDQTLWGEGFKVDEKYIYVNAIRLFRFNATNLICPPLIGKYLDEVKGTDNGIRGGMHNSTYRIRQYTHLCLVINDSEIALWPYPRDIETSNTTHSQ